MADMQEFFERSISGIGFNDVLDILIVTYVIYKLLNFISETRAQQLVKGLVIIIAAYFAADFLKLHTISWILKGTFTIGIFALIVVFQPEIRRALEVMGRTHFTNRGRAAVDKEQVLEFPFVRVISEEESVERIYPSWEALRVNAAPFGIVKG